MTLQILKKVQGDKGGIKSSYPGRSIFIIGQASRSCYEVYEAI